MHNPSSGPSATYPPPVYSGPGRDTPVPPASLIWWAGAMAVLGVLMGGLWWLAAPGGALQGDRSLAETWLFRDLVLAGMGLVAGAVVGWLLIRRADLPGAWQRMAAAVAGSAVGSVLSVGVGQWLGMMFNGGESEFPFVLRSLGVVALWPAVIALVVFVSSLLGILLRPKP